MESVDDGRESQRRPKLAIADVNLASLAEALDDHGDMTAWWFDPATGEAELYMADGWGDSEVDEDHPDERGCVRVETFGSRDAYEVMVDFADAVGDRRAARMLQLALEGRGAFRRFKDTLFEFPELRQQWFEFSNIRGGQRAIRWLVDMDLVDEAEARTEQAARDRLADDVLTAVAGRTGLSIEEDQLVERWLDVTAAIETGATVTVLRDGSPWAYIEPADRS